MSAGAGDGGAGLKYGKPRKAYGTAAKKRIRKPGAPKQMARYHDLFRETIEKVLQTLEFWDDPPTKARKSEFSVLFCADDSPRRPHGYTLQSLAKEMRDYLQAARTSNLSRYRTTLAAREQRWELSVSVKRTANGRRAVWVDGRPRVNTLTVAQRMGLPLTLEQTLEEGGD
jgi:hypothetical protein